MSRPTVSMFRSILIALVLSVSGSAALAADDAETKPADSKDTGREQATAPDRMALDGNVLAGPRTGADAVKRSGRGFSGKGKGKGRGAAVLKVLGQLNLSEAQMEQVRKTMKEGHAARTEFRKKFGAELKQMRQQRRSARESGDRKKMRELGANHKTLMEKPGGRLAIKKQLAKILTPQQMQQFEQKMRKMHRKHRSAKDKSKRGRKPSDVPQSDAAVKDGKKLDI